MFSDSLEAGSSFPLPAMFREGSGTLSGGKRQCFGGGAGLFFFEDMRNLRGGIECISYEEIDLDYKSRACCGYKQVFTAFFFIISFNSAALLKYSQLFGRNIGAINSYIMLSICDILFCISPLISSLTRYY